MTKIIIDNVKDEYVSAFKGLAEEANATFSAKSTDDECSICKEYNYNPSDRLLEAIAEVEMGEVVECKTYSDMIKYLESDDE